MIIGIHGRAGAGKTTVTNMLMQIIPNCSTDSFAKPIKEMLQVMGVDCSDRNKNTIHPIYNKTPRQMMQSLGTEWGREMIDEDVWIKALDNRTRHQNLIISDVRSENEASYIRKGFGTETAVLIHIIGRGGIEGKEGQHASEAGITLMPQDIIIDNSHDCQSQTKEESLATLRNKVLEALVHVLLK